MPRLLFERFPGLEGRLPWTALADLPTPVRRLPDLERATGLSDLWVKRDDLSAMPYGGNKPRKLEFLLGDVLARGAREVVTAGGDGSNHCLATSLLGRGLGLSVTMVTVAQPVLEVVRRNLLVHLAAGTRMIHAASEPRLPVELVRHLIERRRATGRRPYFIYFGGSSPTGTLGFVEAGLELAEQVERGELPCPRFVFIPTGSGGTHAGLALGLRLAGLPTRVVGVRVTPSSMVNRSIVAGLAMLARRLLRARGARGALPRLSPADVSLLGDYFGGEYGRPTAAGLAAIDLLRETEGLVLEPTYSGKALAGMLDWLKRNPAERGPILFWLTYNSRDLSAFLSPAPDPNALPEGYRRYFETPPVA